MIKVLTVEDYQNYAQVDFLYDKICIVLFSQTLYNNVLKMKKPCKYYQSMPSNASVDTLTTPFLLLRRENH